MIMWLFSFINYFQAPEIVPIHYNLSGEPDGYGNKIIPLLIAIIPTAIYFASTRLNKSPHVFNYTTQINAENAKRQYTIATRMIRMLKVNIVLIFLMDTISPYFVAQGIFKGPVAYLFPLSLLLIAVPIVYAIVLSQAIK